MNEQQKSTVATALATLKASPSQDGLYRLSYDLMQLLSPQELVELAQHPDVPAGVFQDWLVRFDKDARKYAPVAHGYKAHHRAYGVSFYSSGPGKRIIQIGFCGQAHLLGIPTPIVLQYFPDETFDFLVLRDPQMNGFTGGIFRYAETFDDIIARLRTDFALDGYDEIRCFGVSGGGAAAIAAGLMLGATVMVSFSGRPPTLSTTIGTTPGAVAMEKTLREAKGHTARISAVYGDANERDKNNTAALAKLIDMEVITVPVSTHSVLVPLHQEGKLDETLRRVGLL